MENLKFLVEKQRPKPRFAKGNTDFWGVFDLLCVPTIKCKHDVPFFIQVRSRKQYGKEKADLEKFVQEVKPFFNGFFAWPENKGRSKIWKFEYIKKERDGKNFIFSEEDL